MQEPARAARRDPHFPAKCVFAARWLDQVDPGVGQRSPSGSWPGYATSRPQMPGRSRHAGPGLRPARRRGRGHRRRARIGLTMTGPYAAAVERWYAANARDLPWREPEATAWSILVSEIMLQQTPVSRVRPAHQAWLTRWPEPAALAGASAADAVRQWDRLGYPRRALRLHASAGLITSRHGGQVPDSAEQLRRLPGVGSYTAAAVASFAFGQRHAVLDTNVRRVLARLVTGASLPSPAQTVAELRLAESLLPADGRRAARWSV